MKQLSFSVDGQGILIANGLHDATLQSLEYCDSDSLNIKWKMRDGRVTWTKLLRVVDIGLRDVTNGMILSDVYCWDLDLGHQSNQLKLAWTVLFGGNISSADMRSQIDRLRIKNRDSRLIFFESSYGGCMAAICGVLTLFAE